MYDIIIIGGGPAGVSAGIYAASRGKKTLLIEKKRIGGIIGNVSTVTHYTAIMQPETGESFATRMWNQIKNCGVEIINEEVVSTSLKGDVKSVTTDKNTYSAKKVIIAAGSTPRKLDIEGEKPLDGKYIYLNAAKDGERFKGKNIYVVGGADGAIKEALYLSQFAKTLTIIHFEEKLGCIPEFGEKVKSSSNIKVMLNSRLTKVSGTDCLETLEITSEIDGSKQAISDKGAGIFVYAGTVPNTSAFGELELKDGFIPVNAKCETAIEGVYAAGDICFKQVRQVATAVADGAVAAINASI